MSSVLAVRYRSLEEQAVCVCLGIAPSICLLMVLICIKRKSVEELKCSNSDGIFVISYNRQLGAFIHGLNLCAHPIDK